jgi:hypothetical protein
VYVYLNSLHVSSTPVLIIRRIVLIRHLVYVTVCRWPSGVQVWTDGHVHRVTYTRCRINTIDSPDDGHRGARNM